MSDLLHPTADLVAEAIGATGVEAGAEGTTVTARTTHFSLVIDVGEWLIARCVWAGELTGGEYVRAVVAGNGANSAMPWPTLLIDAPATDGGLSEALSAGDGAINAVSRVAFPVGDGLTRSQLDTFIADALGAGNRLAREFHALYPERSPRQRGETYRIPAASDDHEQVSRKRVEEWFRHRGIEDLPFDDARQAVCLAMDGTPVDVVVGEPDLLEIRVSAQLPAASQPEPATVLHVCNKANIDADLACVCLIDQEGNWWVVSKVIVPARSGLTDAQFDRAINDGVVGAATQLRNVLHRLQ